MTKNKAIEIIDSLYNYRIWVWYGSKLKMVSWAQQKLGLSQNDINSIMSMQAEGQMIPLHGGMCIVFIDESLPMNHSSTILTIAHEAQHVTFRILKSRGVRYGEKSEEAFTYHSSWLAAEIVERIRTKGAKGGKKK